jgi:hypothetical protein
MIPFWHRATAVTVAATRHHTTLTHLVHPKVVCHISKERTVSKSSPSTSANSMVTTVASGSLVLSIFTVCVTYKQRRPFSSHQSSTR